MNDRSIYERALSSTKKELKQGTVRITAELMGLDEDTDPSTAIPRATRVPMIIMNLQEPDQKHEQGHE